MPQHLDALRQGSAARVNNLDRSDLTSLHEQVAGQIRRSIAEGDAKPGERLPSAKDLAAVLHVNTNTVLQARQRAGSRMVTPSSSAAK